MRGRHKPRPPIVTPPVVSSGPYYNGAGFWRPTLKSYTGAQSVVAVEQGQGNGSDLLTASNYPNAQTRLYYKHGGVANDATVGFSTASLDVSNSIFTKDYIDHFALTAQVAKTGGANMHGTAGNGSATAYFMDLGNAAYRTASATEVVAFLARMTAATNQPTGIFFDNVGGDCVGNGFSTENVYPDGYATHGAWRAAVIGWVAVVADAVANAGYYAAFNMSDNNDTALGESGSVYVTNTTSIRRYWTEVDTYVRANCTNANAAPGFFYEFAIQHNTFEDRYIGSAADPKAYWAEWQGMVAFAHTLNRDYHATAVEEGAFLDATFQRASFLLGFDPTRPHETLWIWDTANSSRTMTPSAYLYAATGAAITGHNTTGLIHWKQYANFTVLVNPDQTTNDTQTINGVSRTVNARSYAFV